MLGHYKEIFYGALFGIGTAAIDVAMHTHIRGRGFAKELLTASPETIYRVLFVAFGVGLGGLLWRSNQREREFRRISEALHQLCAELSGPISLIHAHAQILLTRDDLHGIAGAQSSLRSIYEQSQKLVGAVNRRSANHQAGSIQAETIDRKQPY